MPFSEILNTSVWKRKKNSRHSKFSNNINTHKRKRYVKAREPIREHKAEVLIQWELEAKPR